MTHEQKEMITAMRQKQLSYSVISKEIGVSVNTIKTFCRRNGLTREKVSPMCHGAKIAARTLLLCLKQDLRGLISLESIAFLLIFSETAFLCPVGSAETPRNGGLTMTDIQKQRIKEMRESGLGYKNSVLECRINYGCQHELPPFLPIG